MHLVMSAQRSCPSGCKCLQNLNLCSCSLSSCSFLVVSRLDAALPGLKKLSLIDNDDDDDDSSSDKEYVLAVS